MLTPGTMRFSHGLFTGSDIARWISKNPQSHHLTALNTHIYCNFIKNCGPARLQRQQRAFRLTCRLSAERPRIKSDPSSDNFISRNAGPTQWHHLPGSPRGHRCALCLETDFPTRGNLAEHLVCGILSIPDGPFPLAASLVMTVSPMLLYTSPAQHPHVM